MRTVLARRAPERPARTRRIGAALTAVALIAIGLTGCSASGNGSCVQPGAASRLVRTSGDFGTPKGAFPRPLYASTVQKSTTRTGSGKAISTGQFIVTDVEHYDAATGKSIEAGRAALVAGGVNSLPGLQKALLCSTVGSRIVVTGPDKKLFGSGDSGSSAVIVLDLKKAYPARADGAPRPAQPGMPTVVLAPNGQPGIKIPSHEAPASLRSEVLKQGSGPVVKKVDGTHAVLVNYTAVTWNVPDTVASSSWRDGSPVVWPDTSGQGYPVPSAVLKQLVGKNVGSQLVVVTPGKNATAFVIDVLGIWK